MKMERAVFATHPCVLGVLGRGWGWGAGCSKGENLRGVLWESLRTGPGKTDTGYLFPLKCSHWSRLRSDLRDSLFHTCIAQATEHDL